MNNKIFELKSKEQHIIYLRYLIQSLASKFARFDRYIVEMEEVLEEYVELSSIKEKIDDINGSYNIHFNIFNEKLPSVIYEDFMDKTAHVGMGILNLLADETSATVSYANFRKSIKKTNFFSSIGKLELEYKQILNASRDFRNFSAHVPQSLINAQFTAAKEIDKNVWQNVINSTDYVGFATFDYHHINYLVKLYIGCYKSREKHLFMFERIKKDFCSLVGKEVRYFYKFLDTRYEEIDIQELSLRMQKREKA